MIFNQEMLSNKVVGFHYCYMTFLDKNGFKGGRYGEGFSLDELLKLPFTNIEELRLIINMFNKMTENITVDLDDYRFNRMNDNYEVSYDGITILRIDSQTLEELNKLVFDNNSELSKSQNSENEFHNKSHMFKDRYNCHEMTDSDVLLFVDSNNEYKLNQVKV